MRERNVRWRLIASCCFTPLALTARPQVGEPLKRASPDKISVRLQKLEAGKISLVGPEHVFEANDFLRFQLETSGSAYLYVIDQASSGSTSVLFPSSETQASNLIGDTPETFVPAPSDGWFQVGGPPGFDTVYFLLSPTPLAVSANAAPKKGAANLPSNLMPRCNDAVFKARGECVDSSAGPTPLPRDAPLPPEIKAAAPQASRDLFLTDDRAQTVQPSKPLTGPAVYAFRIAHK